MSTVTDSLGTILNKLRRDMKYTQAQVTELLARYGYEIQPAGISKWEKDLTVPNAGQFLALCKIYGVTDVMAHLPAKARRPSSTRPGGAW